MGPQGRLVSSCGETCQCGNASDGIYCQQVSRKYCLRQQRLHTEAGILDQESVSVRMLQASSGEGARASKRRLGVARAHTATKSGTEPTKDSGSTALILCSLSGPGRPMPCLLRAEAGAGLWMRYRPLQPVLWRWYTDSCRPSVLLSLTLWCLETSKDTDMERPCSCRVGNCCSVFLLQPCRTCFSMEFKFRTYQIRCNSMLATSKVFSQYIQCRLFPF